MERLLEVAKSASLRAVVAETQTKNVPAIRFYRAMGFTPDGIDTSYYTNDDLEKCDVAVFMKRRL
jgi:ribosomal protein S18 acetylase RimI-like enzyme